MTRKHTRCSFLVSTTDGVFILDNLCSQVRPREIAQVERLLLHHLLRVGLLQDGALDGGAVAALIAGETVSGSDVGTMALADAVAGQQTRYSVAFGMAERYSGWATGPRRRVWIRDFAAAAIDWELRIGNFLQCARKARLFQRLGRNRRVDMSDQKSYVALMKLACQNNFSTSSSKSGGNKT
ncbi:SET-domain containing protein lysinemethyltransferase family protein [Striga asiatica]|uniref:SET-domain containing protein lysinemethyltransferase family protein n=1 Tax=Striga asiatica TaxID=4170 RepID=A0A5A7QWG1_STRAF|nr:SET-domain containing protein lysinemethyltransferase family protein [Striga asiatica]